MQVPVGRTADFLDRTLDARERALLVLAAMFLVAVFVLPLWNLTMFAPQYPEGLRVDIYSYKLESGRGGQDLKEINLLNHYIGMKDLVVEDFTEFKWMPFVVGAIGLLFLRAVVHGRVRDLLDVTVMFCYFAAFSLWSFAYKLYNYGHNLSPTAAVRVEPFMPPVLGHKRLANFDVYSYPAAASYALTVVFVLLALAFVLASCDYMRERRATARVAP